MNEEIKELMLTIPQTIVAYDANPKGQHLYGEQRQEIAETLYNAGYRKIDENCAVITKAELKEYKRQDVKEFAEKLKRKAFNKDMFNDWAGATYVVLVREIDELLKEYEK